MKVLRKLPLDLSDISAAKTRSSLLTSPTSTAHRLTPQRSTYNPEISAGYIDRRYNLRFRQLWRNLVALPRFAHDKMENLFLTKEQAATDVQHILVFVDSAARGENC